MAEEHAEFTAETSPSGRRFLGGPARLTMVAGVVVLAVAYLIYAAFPGSTRYYLTVEELAVYEGNVEGRTFRVKGNLVPDSFRREPTGTRATFALTFDGALLNATYDGVVPDLFFNEHSEIMLEGRYNSNALFDAQAIIVKCPSKYQATEETT